MKRVLKVFGIALAVVAGVLILVTVFFLGPAVRKAVTTAGPRILGVPVELGRTTVLPLHGQVRLVDLKIGNPEGFKSPQLFALANLSVDLQPRSVFSDTIVVDSVTIRGVDVTYETSGLHSNIGRLLEHLERQGGEPDKKPEPADGAAPAGPGKRTVIKRIVLEDLNVTVAATLAGGKGITLPLARIELTDLGDKHGGVSAAEASVQVVKAIAVGVTKALADNSAKLAGAGVDLTIAAGKLAGKSAIGAGELGASAVRAAAKETGKTLVGLKDRLLGTTNANESAAERDQ